MCVYLLHVCSACEGQKRTLYPQELELEHCEQPMEIKPGSSGRVSRGCS